MLLLITLVLAAVFSGAALLVTVAEQPARLALEDASMLTEWRRSYDRAAPMQGGLALVTGAAGLGVWWTAGSSWALAGAVSILACWPFVLLVVMPVNRRLKALTPAELGEARPLIVRWGKLHAVRTALGIAATVAFACASYFSY
ncbi:MAG: DUF1772 domain-containing protein [Betaproteobacteria bacterium]